MIQLKLSWFTKSSIHILFVGTKGSNTQAYIPRIKFYMYHCTISLDTKGIKVYIPLRNVEADTGYSTPQNTELPLGSYY